MIRNSHSSLRKNLMELFEIHITGDESILAAAAELSLKTISVILVGPQKEKLRTEHMTSLRVKHENYEACKRYVDKTVEQLKKRDVEIIRVKIESPDYTHYRADSLYMESHFEAEDNIYPMSRNARKEIFLATDRTYNKEHYDSFKERYQNKELELCLFDSYIEEDADWFQLYPKD